MEVYKLQFSQNPTAGYPWNARKRDSTMKHDEQRGLGLKLAKTLGAVRTQDILKDANNNFEAILKAASTELGPDKLVANVLQGPAEWSYHTLRYVPNLTGDQRDALIRKAAEEPLSAVNTIRFISDLGSHRNALIQKAGALAQPQGEISGFYLNNKGSYNCEFTMYWSNAGKIQPNAGSQSRDWVWSSKLMVGQDTQRVCSDFALPVQGKTYPDPQPNSPLAAGNEVWMYLWVQAGSDIESPLRFTYNPNTANYAWFTSSGCTLNDALGLDKIAPPAKAIAA